MAKALRRPYVPLLCLAAGFQEASGLSRQVHVPRNKSSSGFVISPTGLVGPISPDGEMNWRVVLAASQKAAAAMQPEEQGQTDYTCGQSGMPDWGMSIPAWQRMHPGVDGFCYFQNLAPWFTGLGSIINYDYYGQESNRQIRKSMESTCHYLGEGKGPVTMFRFDGGTLNLQLDHCSNRQDDPYCYSFGWLQNQHFEGRKMKNWRAWKDLGRQECDRLKNKYQFLDEEVTVGRHVFDNIWLFRKTLCAIDGNCTPPTARDFAVHVYTKCLLGGDVAAEMAYCHKRGCLLPGMKIRHGSQCGPEHIH